MKRMRSVFWAAAPAVAAAALLGALGGAAPPAGGAAVVQAEGLDVIFVPTPQEAVERMLELAKVTKDDVVYDLGCGDGRIVCTAAKKYGCKARGFDLDPERVKDSVANVRKHKVEKLVTIGQADIFELDLSEATVITLYLLPSLNVKLIPQLRKLRQGCRIVSHDFDMEGIKPVKVEKVKRKDGRASTVYLWETPLVKAKK